MTGPKLNEATFVAGERPGTKASAKYVHVTASKARAVLDLIRGLPVRRADEVLQFSDRSVSNDIRKVLASAVANAQHNDEQDPAELFVRACFADEGPTLKRFRPRAKGRATRVNKRTCHLTIVLDRLSDAELEIVQAREVRRTAAGRRRGAAASGAAGRRARVERSRQRAAELKREGRPSTKPEEAAPDEVVEPPQAPVELPAGAVASNEDGSAPEGYDVKGNADSGYYHTPESPYYGRTVAELWFKSAEDAEAAGFTLPPSLREGEEESTDATSGAGGEGSASDEPQPDEETAEPSAGGEGSASDEPQPDEETAEPSAGGEGSASDEPQPDEENRRADEEGN